ncbi:MULTISPECIES: DUF1350 family protein [Moorena]|uniref:DUF1350 domain-containing protein n=1 Tax=Moorena producens 3L TaxID=489825 RepID=F4Y1T2_9CYAN|nr:MULTISPECIES: DUF1350 family protein [Moorena]EGJ29224.1 protein of unknown function, DUF1350 [Moorena producens 3L]NEP67439.1 DUF1350 domain-containing protein [Moorena sp. SIO3A5]NER88993.1 DUF1350 domain-containing protein [Moorena sp. SIO3A2]OLT64188.1 hypothetical protein BI334_03350 [Moorena producens 3L]
MNAEFKFRPIPFAWVAIHPKPIGVVQLIGGAFFGSFPTIFYRYIAKRLFESGYTVVARPFRFTFRHWPVAIGLVKEEKTLFQGILEEAKKLGYEYSIYQQDSSARGSNYFWLGHSLGTKYIALLELLSDLESKKLQEILGDCVGKDQEKQIEDSLRDAELKYISLINQPSVLMAPVISGTSSAVPVPFIADLVDRLGFGVLPTPEQTYCLIKNSRLFNLTALISFSKDKIAQQAGTVRWLEENLGNKLLIDEKLPGKHLTPLGWLRGNDQLADTVIQVITKLAERV